MTKTHLMHLPIFVALLLLAACGAPQSRAPEASAPEASATQAPAEVPMAEATVAPAPEVSVQVEPVAQPGEPVVTTTDAVASKAAAPSEAMAAEETATETVSVELPEWASLPLVNAKTGNSFTLADYAGETLLVQPMATWCTTCRRQMHLYTDELLPNVGENVKIIGLSVETNISAETLADYAAGQGYPFDFAVMSPELLSALVGQFGNAVATPPSAPKFVIHADGTVSPLDTGVRDLDTMLALTQGS